MWFLKSWRELGEGCHLGLTARLGGLSVCRLLPHRAPRQLFSAGLPAPLCAHTQRAHLLLQQQLPAAGRWQDLQR